MITTSEQAEHSIRESAATLRQMVYSYIKTGGSHGATDDEIEQGLEIKGSTVRPRRIELVRRGRIVDSGATRKTKSGRKAIVWVAV